MIIFGLIMLREELNLESKKTLFNSNALTAISPGRTLCRLPVEDF